MTTPPTVRTAGGPAGTTGRAAPGAPPGPHRTGGDRSSARTGVPPRVEDPGPAGGHLRTLRGGLVLLAGPEASPTQSPGAAVPVPGSPARTWTAADPLPAVQPPGRQVDVFYSPHPDDETLSMGVLIANAVRKGDRVIVVSLTDGRTTGATRSVDARLAAQRAALSGRGRRHGRTGRAGRPPTPAPGGLSEEEVAAARLGEFRRATADLGVPARDVFLAHLDAPGSDGGTRATVAEIRQVMAAFAGQFPGAAHVTMSDVAERQPDHLGAGVALRQLLAAGVVTSARWTVSRLYWRLPGPAWTWALPDATTGWRVRRAAQEYLTWEPGRGEYAIGFFSVRWQFAALERDVRARVHGTGPVAPGV